MKTWEVIKKVQEENLKDVTFEVKFKYGTIGIIKIDSNQTFIIKSCDSVKLPVSSNDSGVIVPMDGTLRDIVDWKILNEPVDFITAISSDKRITFESRKGFWKDYKTQSEVLDFMRKCSDDICIELIKVKWYIEG